MKSTANFINKAYRRAFFPNMLAILGGTINILADAALREMVSAYTGITLLGALPKNLIYVPFWFLRLNGQNKTVTVMMAVMGIGNILLDILFMFVLDWGIPGAAWASVIATTAACGIGMWRLSGKNSCFHLSGNGELDLNGWLEAAKSGAPAALNNLFQTFRTLCVNFLLLQYGGVMAVAVFFVLNCISVFSLCIIDGVRYITIFSICALLGASLIQKAYGLPVALFTPIACLSISFSALTVEQHFNQPLQYVRTPSVSEPYGRFTRAVLCCRRTFAKTMRWLQIRL